MRALRLLRGLESVLFPMLWVLLLFGFDAPGAAMMTLLSALLHEGGHLVALHCLGKRANGFRSAADGARIRTGWLSYEEEAVVAAAGPGVNLCFVLIFALAYSKSGTAYFADMAWIHALTAGCNLLPVCGYDGERILFALLCRRTSLDKAQGICRRLSLVFTVWILYLSLYAVLRLDGGYFAAVLFLFSLMRQLSPVCFTKSEENGGKRSF